MNATEVTGLLAMINEYDQRITVTDHTAAAWGRALDESMTLAFASEQIVRYYAKESARPVSIAWLNVRWRDEHRASKVFPGLPEFTGTDKERNKWFLYYGILEGVEDLNLCRSRDPWVSPVLRGRDLWQQQTGIPNPTLNARAIFKQLDWEWFDSSRDQYADQVR